MPSKRSKILRLWMLICLLLGLTSLIYANLSETVSRQPTAVLLDIKGGIGPAVDDFVSRGIKQANEVGARLVILQIDTPGGLSKSMRGIIKSMLSSSVPIVAYVAPSGARAASAGTYILYAAQIAAMAPGTNLGAATPVSVGGPGLTPGKKKDEKKKSAKPDASKMKALNDARAYIRSLAQMRGRNATWAEKAVTHAASLSAREALKINVINLVAPNIHALLAKVNGMTVSVNGSPVKIASKNLSITHIQPDWRSRFLGVITDPSVAYILLMIGIYGLFFEFMNPGFVVPGVIGGIAILLGLYGLAMLPVNYVGLALLCLGIIFMIAEAFMPSFGALGIGGVVSFIVGSIFLLKADYVGFRVPIYLIIIVALVTVSFILLVITLALRARRRRVVSGATVLIGKQGIIEKDADGDLWLPLVGERWQCRSDTEIQAGQLVAVVKLEGLILVVKPVD